MSGPRSMPRGVRREEEGTKSRPPLEKLLEATSPVSGEAIPHDQHRVTEMGGQVAQEGFNQDAVTLALARSEK